MMRTFIHLGRNGDIINTLPLLQLVAEQNGQPVDLLVAQEYAQLLDGVSYAHAVPFHGPFTDLPSAIAQAKSRDGGAVNLQVYGHRYHQVKRTSSFILEQWANAGMESAWGAPLVFDRRDRQREAELVQKHVRGGAPLVLLATDGFSSPFAHKEQLHRMVRQQVGQHAEVLDLSQVRAERFYDLLGLFDLACCLITIDTAHMHLAHASAVPVVALSTDGPTTWHRSPRRSGHIWYGTYSAFAADPVPAIDAVVRCTGSTPTRSINAPPASRDPRIVHVYSVFEMHGDALRRHLAAKATWNRGHDPNWMDLPIQTSQLSRDGRAVGDHRDLPFVHDLVSAALERCDSLRDIVLLSNSDVGMTHHMSRLVRDGVAAHGAVYTHRWDFPHPIDSVTAPKIPMGKWYPGSDLFAFSRSWWEQHGPEYPDMLLGAEFVDAVLRQLIKKHAGPSAEIHHCVYHERHDSYWWKHKQAPANRYNAKLAAGWFAQEGSDDLDPFSPAEAARIRSLRAKTTTP